MRISLLACLLLSHFVIYCQDFNILDYGAIPDGFTLNTTHIQAAVDEAHAKGGGRVVIPSGTFLSGSIILKSGVELHLLKEAILLGTTDPDQYVKLKRWKALIMADAQERIAITGYGEINGQGRQLALNIDSLWYAGKMDSADYTFPEMRPKWYLRPQLIEFMSCKDITVTGVTLKNSACWVFTNDQCERITIDSLTIDSDAYWNNDGIDLQDCHHASVTHCKVNSADDGICIKSHEADRSSEDIYVGHCTVRSSASAIKLGAKSLGGFKNITIEYIKVYDTFRSAIAIECVDGGKLENITVNHIDAVNTGNALFIRLGQRDRTGPAGTLKNVTISNLKVDVAFDRPDGAYDIRGPELPFFHNTFPSSITGIPGQKIENVNLENIEINFPGRGNNGLANMPISRLDDVPEKINAYPEFSMFGELPAWGLYVRHMDGLTMKNIRFNCISPDYRPALVFDDVINLDLKALNIQGDTKPNQIILHKTDKVKMDHEQAVLKM